MEREIQRVQFNPIEKPKLKRVAAYARVSCGKDTMLHSLSAQVSYYSEYIQKHSGWAYVGVYADEALSGTKDNRKEFCRMIDDCRSGKIDMVITKSISRFARNTVTLLKTVRELKSINVDVYFEEQNIHSASGDGELMLSILASFAQEESLSVSENCKWRIRNDFKQGIQNSFSLYGYIAKDNVITIDEEKAGVVRSIFDMYLSGLGSIKIARILNEKNISPPRGERWSDKSILGMLKNEKYIGDMLLQKYYNQNHLTKKNMVNKGELQKFYVSSTHPPIVDKAIFDKVEILIKSKKKKPSKQISNYPFKGKVFCGCCGRRFQRKISHGGRNIVWKCNNYQTLGKDRCDNKQVPNYILERLAGDKEVEKIIVYPKSILKIIFADKTEIEKEWSY